MGFVARDELCRWNKKVTCSIAGFILWTRVTIIVLKLISESCWICIYMNKQLLQEESYGILDAALKRFNDIKHRESVGEALEWRHLDRLVSGMLYCMLRQELWNICRESVPLVLAIHTISWFQQQRLLGIERSILLGCTRRYAYIFRNSILVLYLNTLEKWTKELLSNIHRWIQRVEIITSYGQYGEM